MPDEGVVSWPRVTLILELLQHKKKLKRAQFLVPALFNLLSRCVMTSTAMFWHLRKFQTLKLENALVQSNQDEYITSHRIFWLNILWNGSYKRLWKLFYCVLQMSGACSSWTGEYRVHKTTHPQLSAECLSETVSWWRFYQQRYQKPGMKFL